MLNRLLSLTPTPIVAITDESGRALRVSTGQAGTRPEWFLVIPELSMAKLDDTSDPSQDQRTAALAAAF